jgi:predicted nuclease of predicted toxin-antitoxin system
MRVLLDECLPKKLKFSFAGHECLTVPEVGLSGVINGRLLTEAERLGFDVLVTIDQGFQYQQNLVGRSIAVILLRGQSNRLVDLRPLVDECVAHLGAVNPGEMLIVGR